MHQKNVTFELKVAKFPISAKTRRSLTPCEAPSGEDGPNDDELDEEFSQNHEFRGVSKRLQTNV